MEEQPKLIAIPKIVLIFAALLIGAAYLPAKEYWITGGVEAKTIVISIITFFVGAVISFYVVRHANSPLKEKNNVR